MNAKASHYMHLVKSRLMSRAWSHFQGLKFQGSHFHRPPADTLPCVWNLSSCSVIAQSVAFAMSFALIFKLQISLVLCYVPFDPSHENLSQESKVWHMQQIMHLVRKLLNIIAPCALSHLFVSDDTRLCSFPTCNDIITSVKFVGFLWSIIAHNTPRPLDMDKLQLKSSHAEVTVCLLHVTPVWFAAALRLWSTMWIRGSE